MYKLKICKQCGKEFRPNSSHQKYCVECKLLAREEYNRQYQLKNPDKVKQWNKRRYLKHKEQSKEYGKQWRLEHPEYVKQYNKQYYLEHTEQMKEYAKQYGEQYYPKHKEQKRESGRQWDLKNIERRRELWRKQRDKRVRNLGFIPLNKWFDDSEAHHFDKDIVIYMPEEYHQIIKHCLETGKNMATINALAVDYLIAEQINGGD